jgi:Fungal cellulose binding domain
MAPATSLVGWAVASLLVASGSAQSVTVNTLKAAAGAQCGGLEYLGPTTCVAGYKCVKDNINYSQCRPIGTPAPTGIPCAGRNEQCGGESQLFWTVS